ncbi:germination protein YpeB [Amphibacillus jilinensis]|uniref:germination protein YpeB n=1 Tax=Amphibacillus jilinensis TaxID=1216008 RepID=UPI0003033783|nr:germination protein YpeB [Amphibacillus jilinensis]
MAKWITITLLSIGLIVSATWGFQQSGQKESMMIHAENNYQRAFHDLTYHLDLLHDKIGTTLALNSKEQLSPQLLDIWRLTSQAQTDVSQLPLVLLPFSKTEGFLSEVGDFTYDVAVRDLEHDPLSDKEIEKLSALYDASDDIRKELRTVQHEVLGQQLRWVDVELALASEGEVDPNLILDGFTAVENRASGFSETHFQNLSSSFPRQHDHFSFLEGEEISEQTAINEIATQFDLSNDLDINLEKSGDGAQLPMYSGSFTYNEEHGYVEITEKGGHILSYMLDRPLTDTNLGLNEAQIEAEKLLKEQGFEDVILLQSSQYDQTGFFQFVGAQEDIWIYPDKILVKVALDNGDIIGYNATDFYRNHRNRDLDEPKLSLEEAEDKVNHGLNIEDQHLAVVEDVEGEEVLSYAFFGTLNHDTYRIFINAATGEEVLVERLQDVESKWGQS